MVLLLLIGVAGATTDITGGTGSGATPINGYIRCSEITATGSGILTSLGANLGVGGNGNMWLALYSDSAGAPTYLLSQTNSTATVGAGWNDASAGATAISAGNYWICFQDDNSADTFYYIGGGNVWFEAYSYASFPSPTLTGLSGPNAAATWNMRMTYSAPTTSTTSTSTSTTSTSTSVTTTSTSTSTTSTSTSTSTTSTIPTTTSIATTTTIPTTSLYTTTTIPQTNYQCSNIAQCFLFSLDIPYAPEGIMLLVCIITMGLSKKYAISFGMSTLTGFGLLRLYYGSNVEVRLAVEVAILAFVTIMSAAYETSKKR
jgi:hypothetical protein